MAGTGRVSWYEQQMVRAYLGGKKIPEGNTPVAVMSGVAYRTPLTDEGHILGRDQIGEDDQIFLCGRSVNLSEWYATSGASLRWGPEWYVVVDTRKGNKCSICATRWKAGESRRSYEATLRQAGTPVSSAITQEEWVDRKGTEWAMSEQQFALQIAYWAQVLGGEVMEDE